MKNFTTILILSFLVILLIPLQSKAQCTLGANYDELKKHYNSKAELSNWQDEVIKDGTKYVSYEDKSEGLVYCSYFDEGIVAQYKIIGSARPWANTWGEYFDKNFAIQGGNTWVDYASKQKWRMKV